MIRPAFASFLLLSISFLVGCGSKVPTPSEYDRWNSTDGTFSIDYPKGWSADGGGKNGVQWAEFTKGGVKVLISNDISSSVVGDIANSGSGMASGIMNEEDRDPNATPIAAAHRFNKQSVIDNNGFGGYEENEAIDYPTRLGDCRKSPFKCRYGMGTVRGYRATAITLDRGIRIVCLCPVQNWKDMEPAFDHMLSSLGPAQ